MQFTFLGTTVTIIKHRKGTPEPLESQQHRVQTPEEMLELTRRKVMQLQAMGETRIFY